MNVSLFKVCEGFYCTLLSHHTPWQKHKQCPKLLKNHSRRLTQGLHIALHPSDWELHESALKSVQLSHSHKHIFRTTYPHEAKIGYLWSVTSLLLKHIFISSVRIVVGLSVNFERRWIHQSLKTCVSQKWLKWGQMFIKHANMMLKSFVVIRSIRTCKFCSTEYFWRYKNSIKTTKTQFSKWLLLAQNLQKKQTNSHLF